MNWSALPPRFWAKVDIPADADGCWQWTAGRNGHGYGSFKVGGVVVAAHRHAYLTLVGAVPEGLQLDHLCRNRLCVNPQHLEPVAPRVNVLRGVSWCARMARKTHCKQGHPFDEANTYVTPEGGRSCRRCTADAQARRYARMKASA